MELQSLPALPSGDVPPTAVWCGAEHTVVADIHGHLFHCGWNDHGSGKTPSHMEGKWIPVMEGIHGLQQAKARVSHGTVYSDHVAAGGAHSLFVK